MKTFQNILQDWAEVFVCRSMDDFQRFMAETGLSPSQVSALMRLYYNGSCGVSEIGGHAGISNAAASQMIERLVQMNLITRTESVDDRRAKHLALTEAGRATVEQGIDARRRWLEELVASFSPADQHKITEALSMLTKAARHSEGSQQEKSSI